MPRPSAENDGERRGPLTPGAYVLLFRLPEGIRIRIGRLGVFMFEEGEYAYVGSAMGGLEARVGRHLRGGTKEHWHIDYLAVHSVNRRAFLFPSASDIECELATELSKIVGTSCPADGFGSSDCSCRSHLFRLDAHAVREIGRLAKAHSGFSLRAEKLRSLTPKRARLGHPGVRIKRLRGRVENV